MHNVTLVMAHLKLSGRVSMPDSRASSPLTSLSSLDDMEDEPPAKNLFGLYSLEDVLAAQVRTLVLILYSLY